MRVWTCLATAVALATGIVAFPGCDDSDQSEGANARERSGRKSGAEKRGPRAGGFEWTRTPELPSVPDGPVRGIANTHEFEAGSIFFEPRFDRWAMVITDAELDGPTAIKPPGAQALTITDLPQDLEPGVYRQAMTPLGGSYWQIEAPGDAKGLTNWTAPHAYVLQITEWAVEPWKREKGMFQEAGHASGRVAVVYEGRGEFADSWVAGTFEDVVVRYMGKRGFQ